MGSITQRSGRSDRRGAARNRRLTIDITPYLHTAPEVVTISAALNLRKEELEEAAKDPKDLARLKERAAHYFAEALLKRAIRYGMEVNQ